MIKNKNPHSYRNRRITLFSSIKSKKLIDRNLHFVNWRVNNKKFKTIGEGFLTLVEPSEESSIELSFFNKDDNDRLWINYKINDFNDNQESFIEVTIGFEEIYDSPPEPSYDSYGNDSDDYLMRLQDHEEDREYNSLKEKEYSYTFKLFRSNEDSIINPNSCDFVGEIRNFEGFYDRHLENKVNIIVFGNIKKNILKDILSFKLILSSDQKLIQIPHRILLSNSGLTDMKYKTKNWSKSLESKDWNDNEVTDIPNDSFDYSEQFLDDLKDKQLNEKMETESDKNDEDLPF